MRYSAILVGFALATLTAVGAAESEWRDRTACTGSSGGLDPWQRADTPNRQEGSLLATKWFVTVQLELGWHLLSKCDQGQFGAS